MQCYAHATLGIFFPVQDRHKSSRDYLVNLIARHLTITEHRATGLDLVVYNLKQRVDVPVLLLIGKEPEEFVDQGAQGTNSLPWIWKHRDLGGDRIRMYFKSIVR